MRLHENEEDFRDLCSITAGYIGIPEDAVTLIAFLRVLLLFLTAEAFRKLHRAAPEGLH